MNEHVPDSSGLPLRAMVMVLLFLGIIFLLVGFQAMGSNGNSEGDESSVPAVSTSNTSSTSSTNEAPAEERPDIHVYNVSEQEGIAGQTADRLREAGWNVTEVDNLSLPDVVVTTVYFGEAPGEQDAAEAVGQLLGAPVEPRVPEVAEQPPGVIVAVAG